MQNITLSRDDRQSSWIRLSRLGENPLFSLGSHFPHWLNRELKRVRCCCFLLCVIKFNFLSQHETRLPRRSIMRRRSLAARRWSWNGNGRMARCRTELQIRASAMFVIEKNSAKNKTQKRQLFFSREMECVRDVTEIKQKTERKTKALQFNFR